MKTKKELLLFGTFVFLIALVLASFDVKAQDGEIARYYEETANAVWVDHHKVIFQENHLIKPDTVFHLGKLNASIMCMNSFDVLIRVIQHDGEKPVKYVEQTYCYESPNVACNSIQ